MPALIISVALSLYFIVLRHNEADTVLISRGATLTRQLAPAAEYGAFSGNLDELKRLAEAVAREADVTAVTFHDADGHNLVSVGNSRFREQITTLPSNWLGRSEDNGTLFFHNKIQRGNPTFDDPFQPDFTTPQPTNRTLGSVTVELSRSNVIRTKREILIVTTLFSLTALAAGILFSRRLSRDVTEPILALQQTVMQIHLGKLDARVDHHPGQTLRDLEEGINEMAAALQTGRDQLEQRIDEATAELRQKKEEAERMSLAKSRFLAAASHDLRQPLHALTLFTDQLDQQPNTQPQRYLIKQVHTAVEAMNLQLSALLDISRLDLGDIRIEPKGIALEPLIERTIAVHTPGAQAKGLQLRHVPTRARVVTDPRLLERMLGNLLANAIRYTERGGIVIGVRHHGGQLRLEVWDSGIGINPSQLALIFQEFYQVGNPERDATKGLGIGLSIVARLGELLHHPVDVRSIPARGSIFSITLPPELTTAKTQGSVGEIAEEEKSEDAYGFAKEVVLLGTSDDEHTRICQLLENWGCRAVCIGNLDELHDHHISVPDVLIFNAEQCVAVRHFVSSIATPPILIMLGGVPESSEAACAAADGLPPYVQLGLPLRPARLRALLQGLLQATPDDRDESTTLAAVGRLDESHATT